MNGDPYRSPQPTDRRVINRSGQAYQQRAEEPQTVKEEAPKTSPRSSGPSYRQEPEQRSSKKGLIWIIAIAAVVIALVVGGWLMWSNSQSGATGVNSSRFQAVFLVNGQIYFGKLSDFNEKSFKLTNIYYPQAQTTESEKTDATTPDASGGIQLIRLGDEVHGPESEMYISKEQILYYENLKSDSKVSQLIQQNEK